MLKLTGLVFTIFAAILVAYAQESSPTTKARDEAAPADQKSTESPVVARMMAYGKKEEGKVWRDEVKDERLWRLFDLADTKKDGFVTKEQLVAAARKMEADQPDRGRRGPDGGPVGGPGGGGPGFGGGGPGGRGGFGRPQIGVLLPPFVQEALKLTDAQKQQFADLQKDVDSKVEGILTPEQRAQLKEMKENSGRGGPPGGRGQDGRGGPPPDGGRPGASRN